MTFKDRFKHPWKIITCINKYTILQRDKKKDKKKSMQIDYRANTMLTLLVISYPTWCSPNVWWPTRLGPRHSVDDKSPRHAWARARRHRDERILDSVDSTPVHDRDDPPKTSTPIFSPVSSRNHHRYPCKVENASRFFHGTPAWLLWSIQFDPDLWVLMILRRNWT